MISMVQVFQVIVGCLIFLGFCLFLKLQARKIIMFIMNRMFLKSEKCRFLSINYSKKVEFQRKGIFMCQMLYFSLILLMIKVVSFSIRVILVILEFMILLVMIFDFLFSIEVIEVASFGREVLNVIMVILMIKGEIFSDKLICFVELINQFDVFNNIFRLIINSLVYINIFIIFFLWWGIVFFCVFYVYF